MDDVCAGFYIVAILVYIYDSGIKKSHIKLKLVKKTKKIKISFAESCTGGMLSSAITSVSGSSKVFNLGLVTYSNESKIKVLKISKKS